METRFYKTLWGVPGSIEASLERIQEAGYEGFEGWIGEPSAHRAAVERTGLGFIALVAGEDPDRFERDLAVARGCGAEKITVHCGGAHWTEDRTASFLDRALHSCEDVGVEVNFETHRGRALSEPLGTARMLRRFDSLHLAADFSHWTCVTESMLADFGEEMALATLRTRHLHARVGHEEGPQVPDPRSSMWRDHVEAHLAWWDAVHTAHLARGETRMTVDPEYGPPHYQWTDPATGEPLADVWEVSLWTRKLLRDRWSAET